ncbi:WAT1-related protein At5g64700-like isoform X1 [Asparagus officinalis]|uniref:WAT1-related protein At5g64700-like isoform X1 n=2 Tax=Asparagus officinalis TaxID=4686 RepID=UPI00098DE87F|nr:WAT1-related protein At5g64700-like isoform X1 [Asparagus officinalis]
MDQCYAKTMEEKKPYIAMIIVQIIFAGMAVVSKAAFNGGMNTFVFTFYRQAIATLVLLPLAIIFERRSSPPLPFKLMFKIFMVALFGYTINLNMHNIAIKLTSATVTSATSNLIPIFTFVLALLSRVEIITIKTCSGIVKAIGVVICLTGAMVIAFYKGPHLNSFIHHHPILHGSSQNDSKITHKKWIIGTFLMVLAAFCWSSWLVLLGIILKEYPSWIWSTVLLNLFSTIQCFIVAITTERNLNKWKLHWDEELLGVVYSGVLVSALVLYLQTWCIHKRGPVFVAMFFPLALLIAVAASSFLLGEVINLGSVSRWSFYGCRPSLCSMGKK